MRIIAGRHRGRTPRGAARQECAADQRPRARGALRHPRPWPFLRGPAYEDAQVLDAFAGTGAFGLEALSRGARYVTFLEKDRDARAILTNNVTKLGENGALHRPRRRRVEAAALHRPVLARVPRPALFRRSGRAGADRARRRRLDRATARWSSSRSRRSKHSRRRTNSQPSTSGVMGRRSWRSCAMGLRALLAERIVP